MTFPQGSAWQELRRRALDTVPHAVALKSAEPPTFRRWLREGAFSVAKQSGGSFTLTASTAETATLFLSEAALHLDHAVEHSAGIRHQLACGRWFSPAWLVVTFYYWAFFLAASILRSTGGSPWYLSKEDVAILDSLAGSGSRAGAGAYHVRLGPTLSATQREVIVRRLAQGRLHDVMWRAFFEVVSQLAVGIRGRPDDEARLYLTLQEGAARLGPTWPGDLRNLLNYRPGVGYGVVRRMGPAGVFRGIEVDPGSRFGSILTRFESAVGSLDRGRPIEEQTSLAATALIDQTFVMDEIARRLHADVLERRGIDKRWAEARRRFAVTQVGYRVPGGWPVTFS
ncbi:MAG: hypothetical protein KJ062_17785 [Thermoanaerobaculia bacterium]|nr:hypothetical protein [Thermoanaerobaculia bacterium]